VIQRTFDRVPSLDPRRTLYPVRELVAGLAPRSYTWRCDYHLDQGPDGACVGFGFTHHAIARPKAHIGLTYDDAMAVYHRAQQLDEWPGENYEGTSVNAGSLVSRERKWLMQFRWAANVEDMALAVGHVGPVVIGVNWLGGMMDTDSNGFVHATGAVEGGHCILVKGYSVTKRRFTLHQSWGTGWGMNGDAYISQDDMGLLLSNQGEAVVPIQKL
jgi:hypothetical protein